MPAIESNLCPKRCRILRCDAADLAGNYGVISYGDPKDIRLWELRREFKLQSVIGEAKTEFDALVALKRWVRSQWNYGWSRELWQPKDALETLRLARKGVMFECGHYSMVLSACATALGFPARLMSIQRDVAPAATGPREAFTGHSICEIWSNEHQKWVAMDPTFNIHYLRDGVPISALEIHHAWTNGAAKRIRVVRDHPRFVMPSASAVRALNQHGPYGNQWTIGAVRQMLNQANTHEMIDYYAHLFMPLKVYSEKWCWIDSRTKHDFVQGAMLDTVRTITPIGNAAEWNWPVNRVRPTFQAHRGRGGLYMHVVLGHCMPFFSHYETRKDGGRWRKSALARFSWRLHEGHNVLECRGVNTAGRPGIVSRTEIELIK